MISRERYGLLFDREIIGARVKLSTDCDEEELLWMEKGIAIGRSSDQFYTGLA